ncbi:MAG: hypothetical protein M3463_00155 [Verrucomicrobiota bacterium]|nr:hypothetical protein [Verrucomicrobiota bacterium]
MPTALKAFRTPTQLLVREDHQTLKPIKLMVGSNMLLGMTSETYIYPVGGVRPAEPQRRGLSSGIPGKGGVSTDIFHPKLVNILQPGKPCVVEVEIAFFETDIPPQHMWSPESGKYKVLWRTTLRRTVEEKAEVPEEFREYLKQVQEMRCK